ncbi:MAG: hypothetical protein AAF570_24935, partial [Bacteroidota bacterium]
MKRHLYQRICDCLRQYNAQKECFKLSSQIENAKIIYNKGLIMYSLYLLQKTKASALKKQDYLRVYEILDLEKKIESRHITRSRSTRVRRLEAETNEIRGILRSEADWSEFSLKLYDRFIQVGHVKNAAEMAEIEGFFAANCPPDRPGFTAQFFESLYRYQSYHWYFFTTQNFVQSYKYSLKWVNLFDDFPQKKLDHPFLYIKGLHNCLAALYNCMDFKRHGQRLAELEDFLGKQKRLDQNTEKMAFVYLNTARLNAIVLTGEFSESQAYLVRLEGQLQEIGSTLDPYRTMVFFYKIASIYFTMGQYGKCIRLLNEVINPNQKTLREDLQCFSRLLNLIAHFELGNDELLNYTIRSTYRFLMKMKDVTRFHELLIRFLKQSLFRPRSELRGAFQRLKVEMEKLSEDFYERRAFLYLDA